MDMHVAEGTLLAASPSMLDPNFMHSVVLICQHTGDGAYGMVVNRPCEQTTRQVLDAHELLGKLDFPLFYGGPVGLEALQILHRVPEEIPGGVPLLDDLWVGGDLDTMAEYVTSNPEQAIDRVRLVIGYSGWGAGQLDIELASASWLPAPGSAEQILARDTTNLWRDVLRSLGEEAQGLVDQPPDPSWN